MTQELVVLCCAHCGTYQTHVSKKATKWNCKVCNQRQSIKQFFGRGTGQHCRQIVQQLNMTRATGAAVTIDGVVADDDYKILRQLAASLEDNSNDITDVKKMRYNTTADDERSDTGLGAAIKAESNGVRVASDTQMNVNVVHSSKWSQFL